MHRSGKISLNAIRVFAVVAECGSFKSAAVRMGVTAGAVSRQVQNLEAGMGVLLFHRRNNAIHLTETGETFLRHAGPGLAMLDRSIERAMGDGNDLTVQVPTTLATRWLIPLLEGFKTRWPEIAVRVETYNSPGMPIRRRADVVIAYCPAAAWVRDTEILLEDRCRPYLSPGLLAQIPDTSDLANIPALQCTTGNWDWTAWLTDAGMPDVQLGYAGHFDLDDVALRASIAGMGMTLAPQFIIRDDVDAGRLCALPNAAEGLLGYYTLHIEKPVTGATEVFTKWLRKLK